MTTPSSPSEQSGTGRVSVAKDETVNLGAVFDLGGDCYGCRHPERFHRPGGWGDTCDCCLHERARRLRGRP